MAAVACCHPALPEGLRSLPRARLALKDFRKLAPGCSRLPVPFGVMALIVSKLMELNLEHAAIATVLTFTLLLRPSEALRLRACDAVPPVQSRSVPLPVWSFVLHAAELGRTSKTGEVDESVVMDAPEVQFLDMWLRKRKSTISSAGKLFELGYLQWATAWRTAVTQLGLRRIGPPTLYALRHGGALTRPWHAAEVRWN